MSQESKRSVSPHERRGSLGRTIRAVAWSLIGLRKGSEYEQDVQRLNPLHIIAVGLAAVFLLVLGLIGLVNWVV
ncbi:DUF2970 domain-containing protein [Acidovorax sp. RAC01]|uniref:DUF2970 domain-containing protein n=1 Tax=Acidovorax sp. RAC01 TaxID=1842533 RepID=UPI00083E78C1|nr:DUF2970 domain-containing protein [Acidovorax sp. RAC01]AOG21386.1 hypothetical protein BSY15_2360 [Acidovorax sp. RAC01]